MGNTVSLNIPAPVTTSTAPASSVTQEFTPVITPNGGIQVSDVQEPVKGTPPSTEGLILGKFKTQEDLAAAYKELEAKQGSKAKDESTPPVTPAPENVSTLTVESATKTLTDKGLDYMEFANQYAQDGALSSASYEKLISKGITAQQIDAFIGTQAPLIAAQKAAADVAAKDVKDHVGGEAEFAKLIDFVAKSLTPAEVASYNRAVDAGDTVAAKIMLTNFKGQRDAKLGVEPNLNGGTPPQSGSSDVYQALSQYHNDIADPRYAKDAFFRSKVVAKLTRSRNLYA